MYHSSGTKYTIPVVHKQSKQNVIYHSNGTQEGNIYNSSGTQGDYKNL